MEQVIETSKQVFDSSLAQAKNIAGMFSFHAPEMTLESVLGEHVVDTISYTLAFSVLFVAILLKRKSLLAASMAATCTMLYLVPRMVPALANVTFGAGSSFVMFNTLPVEVFCLFWLATFIADCVARDTNKAPLIMSGIIAGLVSVAIHTQVFLFLGVFNFIHEPEGVSLVGFAKDALLLAFSFQFCYTTAMHVVNALFGSTKRFGLLRMVLEAAASVGITFGLCSFYQLADTKVLLAALRTAVAPMLLEDLYPVALMVAIVLFIYIGFIAASAKNQSPISTLVYLPFCLSMSVLAFMSRWAALVDAGKPGKISGFAQTPQGKVVMGCAFFFGMFLASLALFKSSANTEEAPRNNKQRPNKPLPKPKASGKSPSKSSK